MRKNLKISTKLKIDNSGENYRNTYRERKRMRIISNTESESEIKDVDNEGNILQDPFTCFIIVFKFGSHQCTRVNISRKNFSLSAKELGNDHHDEQNISFDSTIFVLNLNKYTESVHSRQSLHVKNVFEDKSE